MAYQGWNEFQRQIMAGKAPSFAGEPGYAYVRTPYDNMASRTELFGVPLYHIYISGGHVSANGYRQYSIRFKDVRHAARQVATHHVFGRQILTRCIRGWSGGTNGK